MTQRAPRSMRWNVLRGRFAAPQDEALAESNSKQTPQPLSVDGLALLAGAAGAPSRRRRRAQALAARPQNEDISYR